MYVALFERVSLISRSCTQDVRILTSLHPPSPKWFSSSLWCSALLAMSFSDFWSKYCSIQNQPLLNKPSRWQWTQSSEVQPDLYCPKHSWFNADYEPPRLKLHLVTCSNVYWLLPILFGGRKCYLRYIGSNYQNDVFVKIITFICRLCIIHSCMHKTTWFFWNVED